jgi:hypothetical protein
MHLLGRLSDSDDLGSRLSCDLLMWPRVFQVGSSIAAALAALVLFFALYVFVGAWIVASQGSTNAAGRGYGAAMVVLSLALLLATPFAIRRSGRRVAGCVVAAVIVFGTCMVGLALILENAY